jgi:glucose/arabinose dehydrogenase
MQKERERSVETHVVANGFHFPSSIAFDDDGVLYVAETGLPFAGAPAGGRVYRVDEGGRRTALARGLREPVNGLAYHDGALFISEGGHPGRISRLDLRNGAMPETVLADLPGPGNYHTNTAVFGPDGKLYFGQGAMTNLGIIGLDAYELGWLKRLPHAHDLPAHELELTGANVETEDPFNPGQRTSTGAFVQFGTTTEPGQRIPAALPCTSAVMRCNPDGSDLELVAWGLRNPYGLGFLPDGRLIAIDQGSDDRGSRPVGNGPDLLFEVKPGRWYGWPDFIGDAPVTAPEFLPESGVTPRFLLANHDELPPREPPLLRFDPHVAAVKFDVAPDGRLATALFGDEVPMTAPSGPKMGRSLGIVDPDGWTLDEVGLAGLKRPLDAKFDPNGNLFVLDFGHFEPGHRSLDATPGSGAVHRVPWPLD